MRTTILKYRLGQIFYAELSFTNSLNKKTTVKVSNDGGDSFTSEVKFCITTNSSFYDGNETIWLALRGGHINKYVYDDLSIMSNIHTNTIENITISPNPVASGQLIKFNRILKSLNYSI